MTHFSRVVRVVLVLFAFATLTAKVSFAQYVDCKLDRYGHFWCVSSVTGGRACTTSTDRLTCVVSTPWEEGRKEPVPSAAFAGLDFDTSTIREIAALHPRFAATLVKLKGITAAQESYVKIH